LFQDLVPKGVGQKEGVPIEPLGAAKVEIGFIDGGHLHRRSIPAEDSVNALGVLLVFFVLAVKEKGVGAE
jgi:hypothetical protein